MTDDSQLMDAQKILINPLNRSTSKQQYSFNKAQRFHRCKTENQDYKFYNIPTTNSRKTTTLGKSQRNTFDGTNKFLPSPNIYNYVVEGQFGYSSAIKKNQRKSKGFGFGLGRQDIKINSFIVINKDIPNPGSYNPQNYNKSSKNYSFSKEERSSVKKLQFPLLGPGKYNINTSLQQKKQILSSQRKFGSPKIYQAKIQSRRKHSQVNPPYYHPKTTAKGDVLNFKTVNHSALIGKSIRMSFVPAFNVPGPGRYKKFSEFISKGKC